MGLIPTFPANTPSEKATAKYPIPMGKPSIRLRLMIMNYMLLSQVVVRLMQLVLVNF